MTNEILNTCQIAALASPGIRTIAGYSHIVPIALSLILGTFVLIKAKYNFFSKVFFIFTLIFGIWLIGDIIAWTSNSYSLVYTTWAFLDYVEILFYALGLYFTLVFVNKKDISFIFKCVLLLLTLPAFLLTINQQSVIGFNQPVCEAFNNDFLGTYKILFEGIILSIILIYAINPFFRRLPWKEIRPRLVVLGSMFFFLATFGITEYLASVTGYYELNLYSLFLLPVFLFSIIYSIFELDVFNVKTQGTHYLVVGLVIVMSGQLFFITNTTNRLLTVLSIMIAIGLSYILFRNLKRESDQRVQIVKLNTDLQKLIEQRESLVHLVTHKVKGSFTRSKYIFAGLLDGTFGEINPEVQKYAKQGLESDNAGIQTVDLVLNAANLTKGNVKYELKPIDFKEMVMQSFNDKKVSAEAKGLKIEMETPKEDNYKLMGDVFWLKEAVNCLIENSIRYTKKGEIKVKIEKIDNKIKFSVTDTGVGITDEDKKKLFTEGGRGKDSVHINVDSTGYGLYSAKLIVEAHHGKVWGESEGPDKGSQFYIELDALPEATPTSPAAINTTPATPAVK